MFITLWLYQIQMPGSVYTLYVWREVYMVLLIEMFWSLADSLFSLKAARKSYGFVLAISSLGGLSNLLVGPMAQSYGTPLALLGVVPCLLACVGLTYYFANTLEIQPVFPKKHAKAFGSESLGVVWKSKYLVPMLFLIAIVQISISLIDIQFNTYLEQAYTELDLRTLMIGRVHAIDNTIAAVLQLSAGFIIKMVGIGGIFVGIPLILGTAILSFLTAPTFLSAALLKIVSKTFDYSLLRASKEMLYIPLSHPEKTQGKALIDILIYRIAKSSAALLILFLAAISYSAYIMNFVLSLVLIWILLAVMIVKRYKSVVSFYHDRI
ncbi:MAG: hypothetical protein JKY15_06895 [Deltaproteobacteria bacterium]|nr:hypothetical protein [Deltaproteobacteria bacterium]